MSDNEDFLSNAKVKPQSKEQLLNDLMGQQTNAKIKNIITGAMLTEGDFDIRDYPDILDDVLYESTGNDETTSILMPPMSPKPSSQNLMSNKPEPSSGSVVKVIRSKLIGKLQDKYSEESKDYSIDDESIQAAMNELIQDVKENLLPNKRNQTVGNKRGNQTNTKIVEFLQEKLNVFSKEGDTRGCVTRNIGDAQQMKDMWGRNVTEYAKSAEAKCYLCGLKIVPYNSCPEAEHKLPAVNMFTDFHHYRILNIYRGKELDGVEESIYTLWNNFINNRYTDNTEILKDLYKAINETDEYESDNVDQLYNKLYNTFLIQIGGGLNDGMGSYAKDLIKAWLIEFAYAHHICNQVKGNMLLNKDNYTTFTSTATTKHSQNKNREGNDLKGQSEANALGTTNKFETKISDRKYRTIQMFDHLNTTRTQYINSYSEISTQVKAFEDEMKVHFEDEMKLENLAEVMVMMRALYYIVNSVPEPDSIKVSDANHRKKKKKSNNLEQTKTALREETKTALREETLRKLSKLNRDPISGKPRLETAENSIRKDFIEYHTEEEWSDLINEFDNSKERAEDNEKESGGNKFGGGVRQKKTKRKGRRVTKKKRRTKRKNK